MFNKQFFSKLKSDYAASVSERRQIIAAANTILHDAKRVIFALHRHELKNAMAALSDIETRLKKLEKTFGYARLNQEGAYTAAGEEYAEAKLFYLVVANKKLEKFKGVNLSTENYLGGLADLLGEMARQAVNLAADGKLKEVTALKNLADDIMAELVNFDMSGYLRTKYDQARGHLRKLEQINYEISLRSCNT